MATEDNDFLREQGKACFRNVLFKHVDLTRDIQRKGHADLDVVSGGYQTLKVFAGGMYH